MFVIGYMGRLLLDKGIQELLVLAHCLQFYKNIEIHIAGSITSRAGASERLVVHALMQLPSVKFYSNLSSEAKRNFVSNIDLGILLSPREGCSRWLLEVLDQGKPVICYRGGGNELLRGLRGVHIFARNNWAGIMDTIQRLSHQSGEYDADNVVKQNAKILLRSKLFVDVQLDLWRDCLNLDE